MTQPDKLMRKERVKYWAGKIFSAPIGEATPLAEALANLESYMVQPSKHPKQDYTSAGKLITEVPWNGEPSQNTEKNVVD